MASSSFTTNSEHHRCNYDVFLSFRGVDSRKTFTSHLYEGLNRRGINTFIDDRELEHGTSISEELFKAIEGSQVALVVFSRNYASSRWCLDELVKIMECKDEFGLIVIPIFYGLEPSEVRNQSGGSFAKSFIVHESKYKDDVAGMQKVQRWRTALTATANLSGHDIRDKSESDCIKHIVDHISSKLCQTSLPYSHDVVGIDTHLEKVKSLLEIDINDVRIVGIWGIGGIGKTTIANAIFRKLSNKFDVACFLADVKENKDGIHSLQNILLSELLGEKLDHVNNKEDGKDQMARRLRLKKVLVVLDDIDHKDHLDYLAGDRRWFGDGSRIIATTRNKHLIKKDDVVYEVTILPDDEAMQLFNQHAFENEVPDDHFKELTLEVVNHAKGLPLALKVWGSLLHNRGLPEWQSAIDRIKKSCSKEIVEKLKISYDGLEPEEQEIFLDIACFFRGDQKNKVMKILESCDFRADIGLDVLIKKSLVFISGGVHGIDTIEMHDLIQAMGKYVVNMQKNPGQRCRIWDTEDVEAISNSTEGTKATEGIVLYDPPELFIQKALKNMNMLRMLCITQYVDDFSITDKDGSIENLPNSLRYFVWNGYPWASLPANFEPKRLIHLQLQNSLLFHLRTETKDLRCLRKLDLSFSRRLMQTPDFTRMPNLEYVSLKSCISLEEGHSSLGNCNKLIWLNLNGCRSLKRFPQINVESLEFLDLRDCNSLEKFPEIVGRMKLELEINMQYSGIRELASYIQYQTHVTKLDLSCLRNLESLPKEIGNFVNLEWLDASNTLISQPPPSIVQLNKLHFLSFAKFGNKGEFVFPPVAEGLRSLDELNLRYCNLKEGGLPKDFGCLSSLKKLDLTGNNFAHLPQSIGQLVGLRYLNLSFCKRLKQLPDFTGMLSLEILDLLDCTNLEGMHHSVGYLKKLTRICLSRCQNLKRFPAICIDSLQYLNLWECHSLQNFPEILGSMKLELEIHMLENVIRDLDLFHDLRQNICSNSWSQRVFSMMYKNEVPRWFNHQGMDKIVSVTLPYNWYECDDFLGVAVCYSGKLIQTRAEMIPVCADEMDHELPLCNHSEFNTGYPCLHFFLVPIAGLWDISETSGKKPSDYGLLRLSFSEIKQFGFRILYINEPKLDYVIMV